MFRNYRPDRCYIIAEIGGNFTSIDQARILIDQAMACGVDAIKLQTYRAETLTTRTARFEFENTGRVDQFSLFRKYEISAELHRQVFEYAAAQGLDWFSTPSHATDADLLEGLGVGAHKVGSDDAVNLPFLRHLARLGKPILLSTGMCSLEEVRRSVAAILEEGNPHLYLFHAVSCYPCHPAHVNLRAMTTLMQAFPGIPVGYSDHTLGSTAALAAVAMGARLVEKHFTYDKQAEGPDHMHSADPAEMRDLVARIRELEVMLGDGLKRPAACESRSRHNTRKSVTLTRALPQGGTITRDAIAIKRPGYGIPPAEMEAVLGRRVGRDLPADTVLTWEDLA